MTTLYLGEGVNEDCAITIRVASDTVAGSSVDPTINIIEHPDFVPPGQLAPGQQTHSTAYRLYDLGEIDAPTWTNSKFYDFETGKGLVADVWGKVSSNCQQFCDSNRFGKFVAGVADDNTLILKILDELKTANAFAGSDTSIQAGAKEYDRFFRICRRSADFWTQFYKSNQIIQFKPMNLNIAKYYLYGNEYPVGIRTYSISPSSQGGVTTSKIGDGTRLKTIGYRPMKGAIPGFTSESYQLTDDAKTLGDAKVALRELRSTTFDLSCRRDLQSRGACTGPPIREPADTRVYLARDKGQSLRTSVLSETGAKRLITAGGAVLDAALGAVFAVLDFIHGQWVGAVMGIVGTAIGVAAGLVAGLAGIVLGLFLGPLFAILPGMFNEPKPPPPKGDTQKILQWRWFGDSEVTGDEGCKKKVNNTECTGKYGLGTISLMFDWEYFHSAVFALIVNEGHTMSLSELAAPFAVQGNDSEPLQRGTNIGAWINCHNEPFWQDEISVDAHGGQEDAGGGKVVSHGDWPGYCTHPTFHLDLDQIILPNTTIKASDAYTLLISDTNPGGSCKVVDNTVNIVEIPDQGISYWGLPVTIACGINSTDTNSTATTGKPQQPQGFYIGNVTNATTGGTYGIITNNNPGGAAGVPKDLNATSAVQGNSPGEMSTDGIEGEGYVPPPQPPPPFGPSINVTNGVCLSGDTGGGCFPNGTYDAQMGTFGFSSAGANNLSLCSGCSLVFSEHPDQPFNTDQSAANQNTDGTSINARMKEMQDHKAQFSAIVPQEVQTLTDSLLMMYTEEKFGGDVVVLGPGGGNMTAGRDMVKSARVTSNTGAWLYPNGYGDKGGQRITGDTPSLSTLRYGANDSLEGKVEAVWVTTNAASLGQPLKLRSRFWERGRFRSER